MTGRTLGHYEILEKLGEGGMGVVYKARDTRLNRFVAVKVLPPERVADPARKRRFIQEAQAASALNHPNIVVIHDIAAEDGVDYMVMEHIAGKSLDQHAGRRGLRLAEALKYAVQIADGLAAAHRAGIVHRDLKPSNVMVTDSGLVKLLDFGLAKLTEREEADELAATQTLATPPPHTEEGTIVGTVAYMSPEQAEGRKIDGRSDIFSFGAVLYEMITGQRAFQGSSKLSTLSAILKEEPRPASSVSPNIPREVERLLARCLRKDPDRRFQTMADLKVALEELKAEADSGTLTVAPRAEPASRRKLLPLALAAAALLIAAAAGLTWWLIRSRQVPAPTVTRLTADSGLTAASAVSSDGKLMVYCSDRSGEGHLELWLKQVPEGAPVRLTHEPGDALYPSFSPDGTQITFTSDRDGGGIYRIPALGGGIPALLVRNGFAPYFSPDGKQILFMRLERGLHPDRPLGLANPMFLISASGGEPKPFRPDYHAASALWTPDGNHILFVGMSNPEKAGEQLRFWVADREGSSVVDTHIREHLSRYGLNDWMLPARFAGSVGADPRLLITAFQEDRGNLWQLRLSRKTWQPEGKPERLTSGFGTADVLPSVSAGGLLAFTNATRDDNIWVVPIDADQGKPLGEKRRFSQEARWEDVPYVTRNGGKMAFWVTTGTRGIHVLDTPSKSEALLVPTSDNVISSYPILSPDGARLAYAERKGESSWIKIVPTSGGAPETLCQDCAYTRDWSPDGKWILTQTSNRESRIFLVNAVNGEKKELLRDPEYGLFSAQFSPDSQWIAFLARSKQNVERLFIVRFQNGEVAPRSEWIAVTEGKASDDKPRWSPTGNLLYFTSNRGVARGIWAQRLDPRTKKPLGDAFLVYQTRRGLGLDMGKQTELAVAPDKLLFTASEYRGNIWMMQLPD